MTSRCSQGAATKRRTMSSRWATSRSMAAVTASDRAARRSRLAFRTASSGAAAMRRAAGEQGRAATGGGAFRGGGGGFVERARRAGEGAEVGGGGGVVFEPGKAFQLLPRREDVPGTGEHADRDRVVGRRLAERHPD